MDMSELCASPGKFWASLASSGNVDTASQHPLVSCSIWTFVCFNLIGGVGCSDMSCGESACKQFPNAPVLYMSDLLLLYSDGGNTY